MSFRPPKRPDEQEYFGFDFEALLRSGETIASTEWTMAVEEGVDPTPSAMLSGAETQSGSIVEHKIVGGVSGVTYKLHCAATTSSGQLLELCDTILVESC